MSPNLNIILSKLVHRYMVRINAGEDHHKVFAELSGKWESTLKKEKQLGFDHAFAERLNECIHATRKILVRSWAEWILHKLLWAVVLAALCALVYGIWWFIFCYLGFTLADPNYT